MMMMGRASQYGSLKQLVDISVFMDLYIPFSFAERLQELLYACANKVRAPWRGWSSTNSKPDEHYV